MIRCEWFVLIKTVKKMLKNPDHIGARFIGCP